FGCSGSTALVAQALEWAADPNGDGSPADHLDIVNLSLGSDWGSNDDPDAVAANHAGRLGILVVAAAGNSGDTTFIVSSPAAATAALAVAAAVDSGAVVGAFEVLAPGNLAGTYPASEADFGPDLATLGERQGFLAQPQAGEELGCEPFSSASAAALAGKIALINRGACTFKRKVLNAQNAGAIGVLIVRQDDGDPFTMGNDTSITASITIPAQMTVLSVGQRLREHLSQGVQVRLTARYRNQYLYTNAAREDTVASFSSRGPRGDLLLKPDLTAPGASVFSAANGTGREGVSLSGTSMATPVVAGAAAVLKQARPELAAWQLKALLMNGADPWLFGREKGQEPHHRVSRVGAGRLNLERSVSAPILLYAKNAPEAVSLSLGYLEAGQTASGQVKLVNLTNRTVNLRLAVQQTQGLAGVRLSVVPGRLPLGPGEEREVTVQVETWQDLGVVRDATQAATQEDSPRFFLTELSAHLYAFEQDELVGVLPVYAVVKPGGNLVAQPSRLQNAGSQASLTLTGDPQPGLTPLVVPLELVYQQAPSSNPRPAGVLAAGFTSDTASEPTLTFAVHTEAPWASPEDVKIRVFLDTNRDGTADFKVENRRAIDGTDTFSARVCPLPAGACADVASLGGLSPEGVHIPAFASSLMVLAVPGSEVGLSPGNAFDFWVVSSDAFGEATRTPVIPARVGGNAVSFPGITGVAALPAAPGQVLSLSLSSNAQARVLLLF
ncbi:MAG: S8 family serine peptidase, partial [Thermoanaerobaculum sp.]